MQSNPTVGSTDTNNNRMVLSCRIQDNNAILYKINKKTIQYIIINYNAIQTSIKIKKKHEKYNNNNNNNN